jgi:predicted nucleic acid-binding protein
MSRVILLDAGPLGRVTGNPRSQTVRAMIVWANTILAAGHRILVPAITDYEVRRELERAEKMHGLSRLDAFNAAQPDRFIPLSEVALRRAASLWAQARRRGTPTADPRELDGDVILAAQALTLGIPASDLIIATTNIGHLSQFLQAELGENISP